jgi:hypothetical protein
MECAIEDDWGEEMKKAGFSRILCGDNRRGPFATFFFSFLSFDKQRIKRCRRETRNG